jgi:hypothetical protein
MNKIIRIIFLSLVFIGLFTLPQPVSAQDYSFEVSVLEVEAYVEEDGTLSIWYYIEFENNPGAAPIEYVDIGLPSPYFSMGAIVAELDGAAISKTEDSPYVTYGFALNLGNQAIPAGESGTVTIWIPGIENVLYPYDEGDLDDYVNFQFSPNWFDAQADTSSHTEYRVTIILPPGVGDEEGRYYYPSSWPGVSEPDDTGRTAAEDRVYYSWYTDNADAHSQYYFGVAFPAQYVPEEAFSTGTEDTTTDVTPSTSPSFISSIFNIFGGNLCCFGFGLFFVAIFGWSIYQGTIGAKKRKMKYLPPKMKIEGHGIKRGLTAVEAAILLEQPMDKIMTMILFGTLRKEAAIVEQQEPLKLTVSDPMPAGLHAYEVDFLDAFKGPETKRRVALQRMMINLVNSVSKKMKGFSRKETMAYYEDIMRRAWKMVEDADTPEVKSEAYDNTLEWTMLDDDYEERTRRTFTSGPVFVPIWWPRYSPVYRRNIGRSIGNIGASTGKATTSGGGKVSMPTIPGSDFAAGVIHGVTGMAAGVVGNLTSFTSGITTRTNPIPTTSRSGSGGFRGGGGGGGGSSCACACACAGCACACAGGGR